MYLTITVLASFPGSPHMQTKFCTASDGKLGGAWERGYYHLTVKNITTTSHINNVTLCSGWPYIIPGHVLCNREMWCVHCSCVVCSGWLCITSKLVFSQGDTCGSMIVWMSMKDYIDARFPVNPESTAGKRQSLWSDGIPFVDALVYWAHIFTDNLTLHW